MSTYYGSGQSGVIPNFDASGITPSMLGLSSTSAIRVASARSYTESTGAGTYTASVAIPAGSLVYDVIWTNTALWTAATSATLKVGDAGDDDGYFTGVDVKAAPTAGASLSSALQSTGSGSYKGVPRYYASAGTITGVVTTVGASGNAGRSLLHVTYVTPTPVAATKAT